MNEMIHVREGEIATPYNPTTTRATQAKADAVIAFAARVLDWPQVEEAIDLKIEDQREFVEWWNTNVNRPGNPRGEKLIHGETRKLTPGEAEEKTGILQQQVSEWRKGLEKLDAYRERLIKTARRKANLDPKEAKAVHEEPPLPAGVFSTIVIDPPWAMGKIERDVRPNQYQFDYPTMTDQQLKEWEPIHKFTAEDCHLFCWTTQKFLPFTINELLEAWGFRYVLTMVWHKPGGFQPIGLPQYNCEFIVYGRRGTPKFIDTKDFSCCYSWPRREHSRKPDEFYELIKRVTAEPRIDVFNRGEHEGFKPWGNEVGKFTE